MDTLSSKPACNPPWSIMIPITVHVPDHRVEEFYVRFGEFVNDKPAPGTPMRLPSGLAPTWITEHEAETIAAKLWSELSGPGGWLLNIMMINATDETVSLSPDELADAFGHPKGKARIAGVLGGVGKAIRRAGVPLYMTPSGDEWHYIWDWDGERYSMTPEVAALLRRARDRDGRN